MNSSTPLSLLQLVPEPLPSFRSDVATLFGKYLPRHLVQCHIVGTASAQAYAGQGFASASRPRFVASRMRRELAYGWLCLRRLLAVRRDDCQLIQVRDMVLIGAIAMLVARIKGIPFVYWMSFLMSEGRIARARRDLAHGAGLRGRLVLLKGLIEQRILYRVLLPRSAHVFVQSDYMKAMLSGRGLPARKMSAVPMGVDTELLGARQPWRPGEGRPVIGYLGTLDRSRCLERVVDALLLLRERHPQASLLLVGDAPQRADVDALLAYANSLGLADAVQVTGWLPGAEAWARLAHVAAAVSYIPRGALYDVSSPTKLLEYLALGIPSVANDNPDQADVLGASAAGWLTASTPAALAQAMAAVLDDAQDASACAARGPAYIESARSYRVIAAGLAAQYRAIVQGRP